MKKMLLKISVLVLPMLFVACNGDKPINPTFEEVKIGTPAPDFSLKGSDGKEYKLSDFKGKIVVLEWLNFGCPFVKKHYNSEKKNMQTLQKKYTGEGVVWLSIISSAKGKQGYLEVDEAAKAKTEHGSNATAMLLDHSGDVGRLYGAKTTPHMYVIGADGLVFYRGAIDSIASTEVTDIDKAQPYIADALDAILFGQKIMITATKAYGCSVKY